MLGGPRHFDHGTAARAYDAPGGDTRQWASIGIVDPDTPNQRSVEFTDDYGPLVSVTLQPSGVPCVCRVAHEVAGNGEGEWFPFQSGDEVQVIVNEGDESNCVIVGRLNQQIDAWPKMVGGQDATTNTFGFRRLRTPYILETAAGFVLRSATTGAFMSISPAGAVTIGNSDKAFLALGSSLIGLQNGSADVMIQIDVEAGDVVLEAQGTKLTLDNALSYLYTSGIFQIGSSGNQAAEHVTTVEAVANMLASLLSALGVVATAGGAAGAAALATFLAAFSTPAAAQSAVATILTAGAAVPLSPALTAAIGTALQTPKVPTQIVGVGCPGFLVG